MSTSLEQVLKELVLKREFSHLRHKDQLLFFCRLISRELNAQRVGIWMLNDDRSGIVSSVEWDAATKSVREGTSLSYLQAASYLDAIQKDLLVVLDDALNDKRCAELAKDYLPLHGITSMLDCPLHGGKGLTGVLCVEHVGPKRTWRDDEKEFVTGVSSLISLGLEHRARVQVQRAFETRQSQLADLAELAVGWLWETDENSILTSVVGRDLAPDVAAEQLVGRKPWDLAQLMPAELEWGALRTLMEERADLTGHVFSYQNADETISFLEISGRPRFDDDGAFQGYIGVFHDVTERAQRAEALAASERRYRNASSIAKLGHWVWDQVNDRCSFCSSELAAIYGVTVKEFLNRASSAESDLLWFHPDDRDRYREVTNRAASAEEGYDIVARIVRDDGQVRFLHERTQPVFSKEGKFVASDGVLMDVTELFELQQRVSDQNTQLSNIVDNMPGAIFRVKTDENWSAVYRSSGYYRLFVDPNGASESWDEAGSASALVPQAKEIDRIRSVVDGALRTNKPYEIEYGVKTKSGDERWIWERGRPVQAADGSTEIEGIMIDATQKHRAEQALVKSQRGEALGQLTGGVAHDFNNLLAAIVGLLELMRDDIGDADVLDMLDTAVGAATRASELTKNMLAFAKRAELEPEVLLLNDVVEAANSWVIRTLPANISVRLRLDKDLWKTKADPSSCESALLNLIINARDAMPEGGTLAISTYNHLFEAPNEALGSNGLAPGRYVVLSVRDTGIGMAQETVDRVFEPFFTTKGTGKGSGLGLAMVFGFMDQSGGSVRVKSSEGQGSEFKMFFPAETSEMQPPGPSASLDDVQKFGPCRVLVVEDEPSVRQVLVRALERAGHIVLEAGSGEVGLDVYKEDGAVDLVLTDIMLPGALSGPDLVACLRIETPDLPALFLTGYAEEHERRSAAISASDIVLKKPVRRADLISAVEASRKL